MIHYRLRCACAHEFEGWFRDSAAFDQQLAAGLLSCPICGRTEIGLALMAPSITRNRPDREASPPKAEPDPPPAPAPAPPPARMPDQLMAGLRRLRHELERRADYVGPALAQEARRIHDGESRQRDIYGEATPDEVEALEDEGISLIAIPWVPRLDS